MSDNRPGRPSSNSERGRQASILDRPGIWVTCVRGKEKQTVGELYDLFEELAADMWPQDGGAADNDDAKLGDDGLSLEDQIAREVADMKKPRKEKRFANCQTSTKCVIFISCKPPVDPVKLVVAHINNVLNTGVTKTRWTHRFVPSSATSRATIPDIHGLCNQVFTPFFERNPDRKYSYKVELTVRNHTTLPRQTIIQEVARCVPQGHTVNLQNPEIFILVEVFKIFCGISIVEDYYKLQKFNVMEIASAKLAKDASQGNENRMRNSDAKVSGAESH